MSALVFLETLQSAVDRYLAAVDRWEAGFRKYYRMPGDEFRTRDDLAEEHREYDQRKRDLEALLPHARRLCLKHGIRESFSGLLRITLGRHVPQHQFTSAVGRDERNAAMKCLVELRDACMEWGVPTGPEPPPVHDVPGNPDPANRGLLRRLLDLFY